MGSTCGKLCDATLRRSLDPPELPRARWPEWASSFPQFPTPAARLLIEQSICCVFGVPLAPLQGASRGCADVAFARQVAMYLAHTVCGLSLTQVGRLFARDRTTVAHGCAIVEDRRDDPTFDSVLEVLERIVVTLLAPRPCASEQTEHVLHS